MIKKSYLCSYLYILEKIKIKKWEKILISKLRCGHILNTVVKGAF